MRTSIILMSLLLAACAHKRAPDSAAMPASAALASAPASGCSVYVYRMRTQYRVGDPERPFAYADDAQVGKLRVGGSLCLRLAPGKHTVSVRESMLFMPAWTSGSVEVDVVEGQTAYVRYSNEFDGVAVVPSGAYATGKTTMRLATQEEWQGRR